MTQRHYYRCVDCLTIAAADEYKPRAECSHCSGRLEYMGRVQAARLVTTDEVCKCDGRCIYAKGPNCDCHCLGENHGAGLLGGGFEFVDTDRGPVPRLRMPDNKQAATVAEEWRRGWQALLDAATEADAARDWRRRYQLADYITKVRKSRSHKHRMKTIVEALPNYRAATVEPLQAVLF